MTQLAIFSFGDTGFPGGDSAMWAFLSIGAVALFVFFIPTVTFLENRRKERESFYRSETIRRVAEASGEGAKSALELLREEDRLRQIKKLEGMKVGGLVNMAVGIGLGCMLWSLGGKESPYLVGLIPGLIGVALLTYALFLAPPVQK